MLFGQHETHLYAPAHTPAGKPKALNEAGQAMNGDSGPDSWQAFANMGNIARIMQEKGVFTIPRPHPEPHMLLLPIHRAYTHMHLC